MLTRVLPIVCSWFIVTLPWLYKLQLDKEEFMDIKMYNGFRDIYPLTFSFQVGSRNFLNQEYLGHNANKRQKRQKNQRQLQSTVYQLHHHLHLRSALRHHRHQGQPLPKHSLLWAHGSDSAESMTCSCATALWTVTVKRPDAWSLSWRRLPVAFGAFYGRGMTVQELRFPQSYARLCRTATYGLCLSLLASCRMIGASIWCTRLWQRGLCPIGLFPWFRTCPAQSVLRSWDSSFASTWTVTLTGVTLSSTRLCSSVSSY